MYNVDTVAHRYTIDAYNSSGTFAGRGFTPVILPLGSLGEGGTYGARIKDVMPNLPPDIYKFVVDGGRTATGCFDMAQEPRFDAFSPRKTDEVARERHQGAEHARVDLVVEGEQQRALGGNVGAGNRLERLCAASSEL